MSGCREILSRCTRGSTAPDSLRDARLIGGEKEGVGRSQRENTSGTQKVESVDSDSLPLIPYPMIKCCKLPHFADAVCLWHCDREGNPSSAFSEVVQCPSSPGTPSIQPSHMIPFPVNPWKRTQPRWTTTSSPSPVSTPCPSSFVGRPCRVLARRSRKIKMSKKQMFAWVEMSNAAAHVEKQTVALRSAVVSSRRSFPV